MLIAKFKATKNKSKLMKSNQNLEAYKKTRNSLKKRRQMKNDLRKEGLLLKVKTKQKSKRKK